jgi:hypothetical protein
MCKESQGNLPQCLKQLDTMELFSSLGNMVTNDARYTRDIKPSIATEKAAFYKK